MNRDELLLLIEEKTIDILNTYMDENGIKSREVETKHENNLENLQHDLATLIESMFSHRTVKYPNYKYLVEADYLSGSGFHIVEIADSLEEAQAKCKDFENHCPIDIKTQITKEEIPSATGDRFLYALGRIEEEGVAVDNCDYGRNSIHITWGDWKHSHKRADFIMNLFGFILKSEKIDEENGGDAYSAWRTYESVV